MMRDQDQTHDIARDERRTSRRAFTKTVAAALVVAPLALRVTAQTPPKTAEPVAPPKPQPSPSPQTPPPPSPLALAYAEVARLRFGDKLNEEELTRLKRSFQGKVRTADALRAVKLQNSDEPDFVFSA
jgi:hypothetical protein